MTIIKAFYSFTELRDQTQHKAYNEWHHLDHRPENLLLPGVIWGERWVQTPDCAALSVINDPRFRNCQYVNFYWFRPPLSDIADWEVLAYQSLHWGRRPEIQWVERPFLGWADPVKGYAAPRVLVSPEAVIVRPNLGIHLTISEFSGSLAALDRTFRWYDESVIPRTLESEGAAGIWTIVSSESAQLPDWRAWAADRSYTRIQITWLDADPIDHMRDLALRQRDWAANVQAASIETTEKLLFSGCFRYIEPFKYNWFDQD